MILVKLTESKTVSFLSSLLFSLSSVWFYTGDIYAFVPMYGTVCKSISFIWYLIILLIVVYRPISAQTVVLLSVLTSLMAWIHPLTFMGPGISTMIVIFIYYVWKVKESSKTKVRTTLICAIVLLAISGPYVLVYRSCRDVGERSNLTEEQVKYFNNAIKEDRNWRYNPLGFTKGYKVDFGRNFGYKIQFYLSILIALIALVKRNKVILLISLFAVVCFVFNFTIRECEFMLKGGEGNMILTSLVRNQKWTYFYTFLVIAASFPAVINIIRNFKDEKIMRYSTTIMFVVFMVYLLKIPLARTFYHSYLGAKVAYKTNLCRIKEDTFFYSTAKKFCPDEGEVSIVSINNDAEEATAYMLKMPATATFAGPLWLRYKAKRNLIYNASDGSYYLGRRDNNYFEWKEQDRIYYELLDEVLYDKDSQKILEEARKLNADFLFLEKFICGFDYKLKRNIFPKRNYDLSRLPVVYENDCFAIIDLRMEGTGNET